MKHIFVDNLIAVRGEMRSKRGEKDKRKRESEKRKQSKIKQQKDPTNNNSNKEYRFKEKIYLLDTTIAFTHRRSCIFSPLVSLCLFITALPSSRPNEASKILLEHLHPTGTGGEIQDM